LGYHRIRPRSLSSFAALWVIGHVARYRCVRILLVGLRSPVRAGLRYPVVFHFEQAGKLRLDLPVENPHTLRSPPAQPPP
jgi:hypothetical protein